MDSNIDKHGFRPNVGIVLLQGPTSSESANRVLWARRVGGFDAWQFPQGGVDSGETVEQALFRELHEEVGVSADAVTVLGQTSDWLRYRLPKYMRRNNSTTGFVGQKQKWFLLQMHADDSAVRLHQHAKPEFDEWRWVSYYYPIEQVVDFKRDVYRRALVELAQYLPNALAAPKRVSSSALGS